VDSFGHSGAVSWRKGWQAGVGYWGGLFVVVISVISKPRTIIGCLISTKCRVVRGTLSTISLGISGLHIGNVKFLVVAINHVSVHIVDRLRARARTPAVGDEISTPL